MVELRKRKAPAEPPPPLPKRKSSKTSTVKSVVDKAKATIVGGEASSSSGAAPSVGSTIDLDGFGDEIETNDGEKTTLKALVEQSKGGVVLFTYPKASTPGCTNQACLFRDSYAPLTATGLAIYGLSRDSAKANTTFKAKQALPYPLLCDPKAGLIGAIGMKKAAGTTRGVFAVDKAGKVLLAEPGGPAATVDAVKRIVGADRAASAADGATAAGGEAAKEETANGEAADGRAKAEVAAEVADTAAKVDSAPDAA